MAIILVIFTITKKALLDTSGRVRNEKVSHSYHPLNVYEIRLTMAQRPIHATYTKWSVISKSWPKVKIIINYLIYRVFFNIFRCNWQKYISPLKYLSKSMHHIDFFYYYLNKCFIKYGK